jgi:glycogen debranching enzyme
MPLLADVPTRPMIKVMAKAMLTDHWQTPLPVPTVDCKDKRWDPNSYWRGDVWPAPNYQVATAFGRHGYPSIAASIADKTVANALKNGISEHYHSVTGKPLGVPYIGMCCTIVTMMLDGLCSQFQLRVKQ